MMKIATLHSDNKRWWALGLLSLTFILSMSTWFSASAVIPQLQAEWNLSSSLSAWLMNAALLGFVFSAVLSSVINLPDLLSSRYIILIGTIGAAVVNLLIISVNHAAVGILLRFFTGVFLAGVYPPAFKLLSTWFKDDRGMALGVLAAAMVLGNGSPHLVNGLGGLDWHVVIISASVMTLIGGFIPVIGVREGPFPFPSAVFDPREVGKIFSNRKVRLAIFGYIGHMWELFALYAWFYVFFTDALINHGIQNNKLASLVTFGVFVFGSFGSWAGGILADRWGRAKTTMLMLAISGACASLIGLLIGSPIWILIIVGWIWGFSVVADSAQFSTLVTEMSDQSYVGTALTLQLAAGFLVSVVTVWLIPLIRDAIGWQWTFAFLAPGPILGIIVMNRLKQLEKSSE